MKLPNMQRFASAVNAAADKDLSGILGDDQADGEPIGIAADVTPEERQALTACIVEADPVQLEDNFDPIKADDEDGLDYGVGISRSEIVQQLVDLVFNRYQLTSCDTGFFGELARNMIPDGYYVQQVGDHSFFIKNSHAVSLTSIIPFVERIRSELKDKAVMSIPLTFSRNLDGATVRSLVITELEIKEITRSYRDLRFGYAEKFGRVEDLILAVKSAKG